MVRQNADEMVTQLLDMNKNILILDTCCLLDLIRCIIRNDSSTFEAAKHIISPSNSDIQLVFASLIESEWDKNSQTIKIECERHIKHWKESHGNIINAIEYFYEVNLNKIDITQYDLPDYLLKFSRKLLQVGMHLESIDECTIKAFKRIHPIAIPPAKQGKDSIQDCTIYEETLHISKKLRENGFTKRIVFASSNTTEYAKPPATKVLIETELGLHQVKLATSLNEGVYKSLSD